MEKDALIFDIKRLSNVLDKQYSSELNFRNHCYLRITYDCIVESRWDQVVKKPFIMHASTNYLEQAVGLLNLYCIDKQKLLQDNQKSLLYRKSAKIGNKPQQEILF